MNTQRDELLITTYLNECERPEGFTDEAFWAWEHVDLLIRERPLEAWSLVLKLLRCASDSQLGAIAAGPLETLLVRHGVGLLPTLSAAVKSNARLRRALESVYLFDSPDLELAVTELLRQHSPRNNT